jgi:hypothetical protein
VPVLLAIAADQEWQSGAVEYNFRERDFRPPAGEESSWDA